ncbi:hypothetical protein JKP88DRAFT_208654 [Tribonema minus]|uniref:Calcium/calmodulin-dependent protein kinase II association-domain domain-containing protein n=1 Tax=Tribonema minus TaxID=303371 RepID=A0A836CEG0_9STRA|nr:hypothetical protein JKP88DRAFT_208654 [Tribonema minus]
MGRRTTDLWLRTVTSGTANAARDTAQLYAPDGVLWGTLSEEVRDTPAEIFDYFDYFANKPHLRVSGYRPLIRVDGDVALNTGYYTFTWDDGSSGGTASKRARYSFVYRRDPLAPTGWTIIDHHSSAMPDAPAKLRHAD